VCFKTGRRPGALERGAALTVLCGSSHRCPAGASLDPRYAWRQGLLSPTAAASRHGPLTCEWTVRSRLVRSPAKWSESTIV
jgi:hypothetical protein